MSKQRVWLVFYRRGTGKASLSYDEAIDTALCFGWVDSITKKIDDRKYARKFTPRRLGSVWSKSNIDRVRRLAKEGRMTERGMALFRERGLEVSLAEKFKIKQPPYPAEFLKALRKNKGAWSNFQRFAPSYKRRYLMWLTSTKQPKTKERRITEAVDLISKNVKSLLK